MGADFDRLEKLLEERQAIAGTKGGLPSGGRDWPVAIIALGAALMVLLSLGAMWWEGWKRDEAPGPPVASIREAPSLGGLQPPSGAIIQPSAVAMNRPFGVASSAPPQRANEEEVGFGPFVVLEAVPDGERVRFRRHRMAGVERNNANAEARRRVPSMNQRDFPEPESGCGPIAIVNWLLWLQDERLLRKPVEGSDVRLRAGHNFRAVERELYGLRGRQRDLHRGASNLSEITAAMDRLVYRLSDGELRMHHVRFRAPLRIEEWIEFTSGYRVGVLIARVVEDPVTRRLGGYHAVSLVAGDRGGGVMLNNWGEKVYGTLRNEPDGQFFYPQNVDQPSLRVESAVCFIPFRPAVDVPLAPLESGDFSRRPNIVRPATPVATGPRHPAPSVGLETRFRVSHLWSGARKDSVFQITNTSSSSHTLYLKTFQASFPGGRMFYPTDMRVAERKPGGYAPGNPAARLLLRPGESRLIWFQFDYLEATHGGPRSLVETP